MQLRKEAWKKIRDFNEVWTRDLAIPMRCSTNWAMKPLMLGTGQLTFKPPLKSWIFFFFFQASLPNCIAFTATIISTFSELFLLPALFCGVNITIRRIQAPPNCIKSRIPNIPNQSVFILTEPLHLWSLIHFCIPDVCLIHSRYQTGNLWKILLVHEIGFLTDAGCLCMAGFQWKLNLWKL